MTRSKQSSIAGTMEVAVQRPWPVGLGMVLLVYLALRDYADPADFVANPADLPATLSETLFYLLPPVLALGAVAFFMRRRRVPRKVALGPAVGMQTDVDEQEFVGLVAEAFRRVGYLVLFRGSEAADGVDLELFLGGDRYLVHCRQWQMNRVDAALVRALHAAMRSEQAAGCFIVASGRYSDAARRFVVGRSIRLVPATALYAMLAQDSRA